VGPIEYGTRAPIRRAIGNFQEALRDVKVEDVLAIEIYRSNEQAPPQFANPIESMGRCGSIVVWRRF
jgi:hypothetical protein